MYNQDTSCNNQMSNYYYYSNNNSNNNISSSNNNTSGNNVYQNYDYYNQNNYNQTISPITNTNYQHGYANDINDLSFDNSNYYNKDNNYYSPCNYNQYYSNSNSTLNGSYTNYASVNTNNDQPICSSNISQENFATATSSSSTTSFESSINHSVSPLSPRAKSSNQANGNKSARVATHHQLPEESVDHLNDWFEAHINHPYPTTEEKHRLAVECKITVKQVNSWFCNRRNRSQNTKPKRIKRQLEKEIANVFNELVQNPNKTQVIEKMRKTLMMHDIGINNSK